jgi:hypothetical protein
VINTEYIQKQNPLGSAFFLVAGSIKECADLRMQECRNWLVIQLMLTSKK